MYQNIIGLLYICSFLVRLTFSLEEVTSYTFRNLTKNSRYLHVPVTPLYSRACKCGIRNTGNQQISQQQNLQNKIVGGTLSEIGEFPWRCQILGENLRPFCACSIITPNFVLTAAHCTFPLGPKIYVNVGEYDITTTTESKNQVIQVSFISNHPKFNPETMNNDISILKLNRPLTFNSFIGPICLPWNFRKSDFAKSSVVGSGWGDVQNGGNPSTILRKVDLPVLTTNQCRSYYGFRITRNMICTYRPRHDTCQGDSGGSIDWQNPKNKRYIGIGVVSWGFDCGGKNQPGVYTKVQNYLDFIARITKGEKFCAG